MVYNTRPYNTKRAGYNSRMETIKDDAGASQTSHADTWHVADRIPVAPVWAGHTVGFALLTHGNRQFVAFYDADRRLTVAARNLSGRDWQFVVLPETLGWDSHNDVVLAADRDGFLHLSGNMHGVPLVYFRTTHPGDISTFARETRMTGQRESRVTYPLFFTGPTGDLLFTYRDGGSGNGDQLTNRYDADTRTWHRLMEAPLTDGENARNAYLKLPRLEPDGFFHLVWVWRETPDAATNHDLSYARSRDLISWEKSDGSPQTLPITLRTGDIVDAVPMGGGMINNNKGVALDGKNRPVVTYHKHDASGNTQVYAARPDPAGGWKSTQISDWDYHWDFGGGGSIPFHIRLGEPIQRLSGGRLLLPFEHVVYGKGRWILDEETLRPLQTLAGSGLPPELETAASPFPEMEVRLGTDAAPNPPSRFVLRRETLGPNRDRARVGPLPPAQMLEVVELRED